MAESDTASPSQEIIKNPVSRSMVEDQTHGIQTSPDQCKTQDDVASTPSPHGPASTVKTHEETVLFDKNVEAWDSSIGRVYWLLSGARSGVLEWEKGELEVVLACKARVTEAVMAQLANMAEFDVSDYLSKGTLNDFTVDMTLAEHMTVLVDVVLTVVEKGAAEAASKERVSTLRLAFQRGVDTVREHAALNVLNMRATTNQATMTSLVNADLEEWAARTTRTSNTVRCKWAFPPNVDSLPPVPVPTWENLDGFREAVRHPAEEERAAIARRAKRRRTASMRQAD